MVEYSKNEGKLFKALEQEHLLGKVDTWPLWRMTVEKMFIQNRQGAEVEALRRGYDALYNCKMYRMSSEFERLIEIY